MRWRNYVNGEVRITTRFLLLPLTIGKETRWLERASWSEHHCVGCFGGRWWKPFRWEN